MVCNNDIYLFFVFKGNIVRSRLTDTTFHAGPKDEVATVDAYTKEDSIPVNMDPGNSDAASGDPMKGVKGGNLLDAFAPKETALGMCKKGDGLELNPDSLLKGIISANSDLMSGLKSLPEDLQSKLLKVNNVTAPVQDIYRGARGEINKYNNVVATVGGISKTIVNANLQTLNGLGTMLNSLACNNTLPLIFKDLAGLTNLISNLIREASGLGIPNPFSGIVNCIQDQKMLGGITKNLIPDLIKNSDVSLLEQMANGKTARDITKYSPDFAGEFTSKYVKPPFATTEDIIRDYGVIKSSLPKIDPDWGICRRSDTDVSLDASYISNASPDFLDMQNMYATSEYNVINTDDPDNFNNSINTSSDKYMCLASDYKGTDTQSEIKANFPLVAAIEPDYTPTPYESYLRRRELGSREMWLEDDYTSNSYESFLRRREIGSREMWLED